MSAPEEALGQALLRLRKQCRMSQTAVGDAAGTTQSMVSRYERSEVNPEFGTVERIVRGMGYDFTHLEHALRQVRGEEAGGKPPNGEPPPDLEGVRADARDLVDREVDRRVARIMRELLGYDPPHLPSGDPDAKRAHEVGR